MNGFDVSETMKAVRAMWEKHGARMMNGAHSAPIREEGAYCRPPAKEEEMREIARMWDEGAPTLWDIQKKYGRAQRTIRRILERYATRPVVVKDKREASLIGAATRRAKTGDSAVQFSVTPVHGS